MLVFINLIASNGKEKKTACTVVHEGVGIIMQVPCHTVALDVLQSKNEVLLFIVIILYHLVTVYISFPLLLSFSLKYLSFLIPLLFLSALFSSHGVPSPTLSTSPASESLCPSIMIVDLDFAKLFSTFAYLCEIYAAFSRLFRPLFSYN